jgi:nitroreductase
MGVPLSDEALDTIFLSARSYNGWLDKDVSEDQLREIFDLAKMGPTSANQQSLRVVWCKSSAAKQRLAQHAGENNRSKIITAPVCAILAMDVEFHEQLPWLFPHTDARSWFAGDSAERRAVRREHAFRNATLQAAYLMIAARALGLDCGPMSGFDNAAVDADFFGDKPNLKSNFICSIGYGDPSSIFGRSPRPDFEKFNQVL